MGFGVLTTTNSSVKRPTDTLYSGYTRQNDKNANERITKAKSKVANRSQQASEQQQQTPKCVTNFGKTLENQN